MELNIFMRELKSALMERGISGEMAEKHVSNLRRTFTSDDLSEIEAIQSGSEIEQLADSISLVLKKSMRSTAAPMPADNIMPSRKAQTPAPTPRPQNPAGTSPRSRAVQPRTDSAPHTASRPAPAVVPQETPAPKPRRQQLEIPDTDDEFYTYAPGKDVTTRGLLIFWIGLFLTLPLTLGLAAVLFGTFTVLFVGLSALIVGLIAVLIAVAACGAGVSLVGIIFGITQLFTFLSAGIYEIGLGIMVAGAVLFVSILLYNIAIRFLPWLISLLGNFLGWICGKIKNLFFVVRRECYKL